MSDHSDTHRKGNHPLFVHPPPVVDPHLENLAEHTHRAADRVDPAVGLTSQMMDCSIIQCPSTGLRCSQRRKTTGASRADYPMVGSSFLIGLEEIVTRDTRLCAYRPQSRAFDPRMIGHRQRSQSAIRIVPNHGDVLLLPDHAKPQKFKCLDDLPPGSINGKLGH